MLCRYCKKHWEGLTLNLKQPRVAFHFVTSLVRVFLMLAQPLEVWRKKAIGLGRLCWKDGRKYGRSSNNVIWFSVISLDITEMPRNLILVSIH